MAEDAQAILADYLLKHYSRLKMRMTRMLGNGDLAGDALQDTWLRVHSRTEEGPIPAPPAICCAWRSISR
jgi:DNA-directed RNA polymerase specialized sigma24 family protein